MNNYFIPVIKSKNANLNHAQLAGPAVNFTKKWCVPNLLGFKKKFFVSLKVCSCGFFTQNWMRNPSPIRVQNCFEWEIRGAHHMSLLDAEFTSDSRGAD